MIGKERATRERLLQMWPERYRKSGKGN